MVRKIFLQDVMSLKSAIGEYDNAVLETSSDLLVLDTREIVEQSVIAQCLSNRGPRLSTVRQFCARTASREYATYS